MQPATSLLALESLSQCHQAAPDTQDGRGDKLGTPIVNKFPNSDQSIANISRPAFYFPMKTASAELLIRYMCGDRLSERESEIAQDLRDVSRTAPLFGTPIVLVHPSRQAALAAAERSLSWLSQSMGPGK